MFAALFENLPSGTVCAKLYPEPRPRDVKNSCEGLPGEVSYPPDL